MWNFVDKYLASLRLTLWLLLGIALVAIGGTLTPMADGRFTPYYQHFGFRTLLALLAVNLAACTLKTLRRNRLDRERSHAQLQDQAREGISLGRGTVAEVLPGLQASGYQVETTAFGVVGTRGRAGRWGSTVVHVALLVIMAGALSAELGYVGTLNLLVGDKSGSCYDWDLKTDRPLGFEFRLDRFEPLYYPIELQFAAVDPVSGEIIKTYTTHEGEEVQLPSGISARVLRYFFFEEDLVLELFRNGTSLGEYHALGGTRTWEKNPPLDILLKPVAYRDPVVRQLRSEVSILKRGEVVHRGVIEVNQPLEYGGVTIYQTAYNRDKFGFWSAGFQFTRDPGAPLVWLGCLLFLAGLFLAFVVPYRVVGVKLSGEELYLVPLAGFRGSEGEEVLRMLAGRCVGQGEGKS